MADQFLTVEFWDVGQGDASVIRLTPSRVILIDVGPRNSPVIDWLVQNPSVYIEKLILTHNDADHAGAMLAIIEAAKFRIGHVYFLLDRKRTVKTFARLFAALVAAYDAGELTALTRLEAPTTIWEKNPGDIVLDVAYPHVIENIPAASANETSAILRLKVAGKVMVVWASDSLIESLARHCAGSLPKYLIGPHHGAPLDRTSPHAQAWLTSVGAEINALSVGSNNRYEHPQKSFIRESLAAGSTVVCTQLTRLCDPAHAQDVVKSHARLALPQPNTGVACRGPIRVTLRGDTFVGDELDVEHQEAIQKLSRPQCIKLRPKLGSA